MCHGWVWKLAVKTVKNNGRAPLNNGSYENLINLSFTILHVADFQNHFFSPNLIFLAVIVLLNMINNLKMIANIFKIF